MLKTTDKCHTDYVFRYYFTCIWLVWFNGKMNGFLQYAHLNERVLAQHLPRINVKIPSRKKGNYSNMKLFFHKIAVSRNCSNFPLTRNPVVLKHCCSNEAYTFP